MLKDGFEVFTNRNLIVKLLSIPIILVGGFFSLGFMQLHKTVASLLALIGINNIHQ
jgi:hypothetical protein